MSLLSKVSSGKKIGAQIHVMTGVNGVGKSTWAASFPSVLFADLENGSRHLDVKRLTKSDLLNLPAFRALVKELITSTHDYKTFVIDSIESLEAMITDAICLEPKEKVNSIEDLGYGKGYVRLKEITREIMIDLGVLRDKGVTVILVGHTQVKAHTDPASNQTWDKYIMRCSDKMAAVIKDMADNVFFANHKVLTVADKGKTRAFSDGQRVMYTQPRAGYEAKNRLELPNEMPLSYDAFVEYVEKAPEANVETLISDIKEMAENADAQIKNKIPELLDQFKNNPVKLKDLKNRLQKAMSKGA